MHQTLSLLVDYYYYCNTVVLAFSSLLYPNPHAVYYSRENNSYMLYIFVVILSNDVICHEWSHIYIVRVWINRVRLPVLFVVS